ncbi:MAG: hypothetical protein FWF05_08930 [Oscillospiraceae bacterium]|nr:hypothetical protein [Oscillospiraceae bacterium]
MKNILKELWYGNIDPKEYRTNHSGELDRVIEALCENESALLQSLEGKEKKMFEAFADATGKLSLYEKTDTFVAGFRLGAKIIFESFCAEDCL